MKNWINTLILPENWKIMENEGESDANNSWSTGKNPKGPKKKTEN